jgi:aminopeptidase YwaD
MAKFDGDAEITQLQSRLLGHLTEVTRERDPYLATAGHFYVREYVRQQLGQWGPVESHTFTVHGRTHENLILNLPSQSQLAFQLASQPAFQTPSQPQPPILIGAHYDAAPNSPGADDNATGIAALLEMARAFAQTPARSAIRLVAFDLEETRYELAGSTHYARSLAGEPLRLMLALEMLGYCCQAAGSQTYPAGLERFYPDRGNYIALIGNLKTLPDLWRLSRRIRQQVPCEWLPAGARGLLVPDTRRSDHAAFWDLGYRAILVTDTAQMRNPHYHQASDQIATLDLDFMTRVCDGLIQGLRMV